MRRRLMKSKIHRATVTSADLHYEGSLTLDTLSRVSGNVATDPTFGVGGIRSDGPMVTLPSVDNVTGNTPNNCRAFSGGSFTGPGAICTTT